MSDSKAHSPLGRIRLTVGRKARIFDTNVQIVYLAPCWYRLMVGLSLGKRKTHVRFVVLAPNIEC